MANQVIVTNTGNVQVALTPPANVQVQISRAAIGTVSNVPTANFANYAANVTASNQPNITNVGTLGNLNVSNTITTKDLVVTGNFQVGNLVANSANYANFAGVVTTNAQPNITSVGTLSNLAVSGNIETNIVYHNGTGVAIQSNEWAQLQYTNSAVAPASQYDIGTGSWFYVDNAGAVWQSNTTGTVKTVTLGNNGNINADGNVTAPYFIGNGSQLTGIIANNVANANYANFAGQAFNVNAANITGTVANSNYAAYAGQANTANLATYATTANSVAGANVSGEVANANFASYANLANTANSVNVANVVGIGNIATTNYDGNASNVLYGNGGFYALPTISNVANANYANYAGQANTANLATYATTANSVTGSNVSGVVANANYATYAGTAYSVSGSNVSGEVANANYATYAGTAYSVSGSNVTGYVANSNHATVSDSANSVAGANVSGIVANANYAAYAGNVTGTIANANYATYAGTVITNAQPNITSVGTLGNLSVTGTVTTGAVDAGNVSISDTSISTLNDLDLQIQANGIHISDTTSSSEVDVFADGVYVKTGGDTYNWQFSETGNFVLPGNTFAINYANGSPVNLDGPVANANYANFAGNAFSVNGANVSGTVANANYAAFSNVANSANSVAGGNVSGQVANALVAGTVYTNAQPNITSTGNLVNLNVTGSVANNTTFQFVPTGTNVGVSGQNAAGFVVTDYGLQPGTSNGQPLTFQFVKSRGNVTNPVASSNNDQTIRFATNYYNGNGYPRNFLFNVLATQAANASFTGANVAWAPASFFLNTGHPFGNVTSSTASSSQNSLGFTQYGVLQVNPGTYGPGNGQVGQAMLITTYGSNTDGAGQSGRIQINRARGNRDGLVAVGNTDGVGAITFLAYNGNGYAGSTGIYANVNTTTGSIANGQPVPIDLQIQVVPNAGNLNTTTFAASGNVTFPSFKTVTGGYFVGDGSNLSSITGSNVTGNVNSALTAGFASNANYALHSGDTAIANALANTASGGVLSLNTTGSGAPVLNINGDSTPNSSLIVTNAQASWLIDNISPNSGFSPFRFQTWQNSSSFTNPIYFFRSRGNISSFPTNQLPVQAGDQLVNLVFAGYGDSGNTFVSSGAISYTVSNNDLAGNITVNANISGGTFNTTANSNLALSFGNVSMAGNATVTGNISGANVSINTNGFMKLASYTASALTAITGQIGWMAAVTNSTPGGRIAYWDTTNARWSYVSDNSAV
jgi:hypothetical protein